MMHKRNPGRKGKVHVLERETQFVHGELQPAALVIRERGALGALAEHAGSALRRDRNSSGK